MGDKEQRVYIRKSAPLAEFLRELNSEFSNGIYSPLATLLTLPLRAYVLFFGIVMYIGGTIAERLTYDGTWELDENGDSVETDW